MLDTIFKEFGLGTEETNVYLDLVEHGSSPAGRLAKRVGIPRSSLYGYLEGLTAKGFVRQSEQYNVKLWEAEAPERIVSLINKRRQDIEKVATQFNALLPSLQKKQKSDFVTPRFHYFEGIEGVKHVLRDMLWYSDLETQAFWPIHEMVDILGTDFFENLNVRRIRQNLYTQAIWPKRAIVDIKKYPFLGVGKAFKREIREAPAAINATMGYWAYGNKVAFLSSRRESFGFIVESVELRQMLKTQFDILWSISKPIAVNPAHTRSFLEKNRLV